MGEMKERMLRGDLYIAEDEDLAADFGRAQAILEIYNRIQIPEEPNVCSGQTAGNSPSEFGPVDARSTPGSSVHCLDVPSAQEGVRAMLMDEL